MRNVSESLYPAYIIAWSTIILNTTTKSKVVDEAIHKNAPFGKSTLDALRGFYLTKLSKGEYDPLNHSEIKVAKRAYAGRLTGPAQQISLTVIFTSRPGED